MGTPAPNRIFELRRARGISQEVLGRALNPPVTKMSISRFERGAVEPTLGQLRDIARLFGVTVADLLSEDDNPWHPVGDERVVLDRFRAGGEKERAGILSVSEALVPYVEAPQRTAA